MKTQAYFVVKNGDASSAFELREIELPELPASEVRIEVKAFGLNFADVLARKGMYADAPPIPFVPGYEISGVVIALGKDVKHCKLGDEVFAFTRFGGYAKHVQIESIGVLQKPKNVTFEASLALATQYSTAYYAAYMAAHIQDGEKVLIQAGAGGIGLALIQLAKLKNCHIIATAGSDEKVAFLKKLGVDLVINYNKTDFFQEVKNQKIGKLDVVFDSISGDTFKKGKKLLGAHGRLVIYGAADRKKGFLGNMKLLFSYGFPHPLGLLMASKSVIGVNMLRIGDQKPQILNECMRFLATLADEGKINPLVGLNFPASQLAEAHEALENRKSMGKVAVVW